MKTVIGSALCLLLFLGCSSLPKETLQSSDRNSQAKSYMDQGNKYYRTGQYQNACSHFRKALASHASVDDGPAVAAALSGLGRAQMAMGNLDTAEAYFQQARMAVHGLNQPDTEAQAFGGLGAVELHRQQPTKAITWLEMGLNLPLDDPGTTHATLLHDMGSAHRKLGNSEAAESYFRQALAMHEPLRDLSGIAAGCYSLALLHEAEGNIDQALENARRALSNDKRAENSRGVAQDLTLLGSLSLANGDDNQAQDFYRRARLAWQALGRTEQCQKITEEIQRIEAH